MTRKRTDKRSRKPSNCVKISPLQNRLRIHLYSNLAAICHILQFNVTCCWCRQTLKNQTKNINPDSVLREKQNQCDKQKGSMPKMPEFGIPCIVPRLFQAGSDGEEKQSHQITVRNKILIKTPHPSRLAFSSKKSLSFLNFGGELKREILDIKQVTKNQFLFTSLKTDF